MHLSRIELTNFKNYTYAAVDFSPRLNAFVGLNGVGKTNLLDAIYLLCLCRSHLAIPDRALIRHGEGFFRLAGWFMREGVQEKIVAKYAAGQSKIWERNGNPYNRLTDFIGFLPVVMIAPADVDLVQEGSEERRRFLDTSLSQTNAEYLQALVQYNHLLRQRNAALKLFAEQRTFDEGLIEILDMRMEPPSTILYNCRKNFAEQLSPVFETLYRELAGEVEQVSLRYVSDLEEKTLREHLSEHLEKDRVLERTSRGVHRDDIHLYLNGHAVKRFASQGQLKSFLLALRLAQYELIRQEKKVAPILLLDDIFDKLDEQRVRRLIGLLLARNFGQVFLSDTHRDRLEAIVTSFTGDYKIISVADIPERE